MTKIVGKTLGMVGYGIGGTGTNNWAADMESNLRKIDALLQAGAVAIQNGPPGSPFDGQVYVVGSSPTGAWSAHANEIARFNASSGSWDFSQPTSGWWIAVGGTDYRWSGTAWVAGWSGPSMPLESFTTLGVGAFGGAGQPTAYAYQILSNKGSGFQDGRGVGWKGGFLSSDSFFGIWQDANTSANFKPLVFGDSVNGQAYKWDPLDSLFKHRFTGNSKVTGSLEVTLNLQIAGVNRITSTGEGQFTGLRLTNLSVGQIPVASDANGQIAASGLTDDGTFLSGTRVFRLWNTMACSGNTWTDLQWTQDAQQRVSMLGSNGSGGNAYHILTFVPNDTEAAGRDLGYISYGQKVSGKSGGSPGIKIDMFGRALGAGGSVGGFGGQWGINYRPDNGSALLPALRVGAFGGGVQDAVEAAILLRAAAGLNIAGLGSSGALGVDASGNVVLQQSVRFQALAASVTGDNVERSVLGQSSAKRLIPANSIASGDVLEIVEDFVFYWGGNSTTWDFYVGPDGTYTSPYRLPYTITAPDLGSQGYTRRCKVAFTARFFGSGASVTAKVNIEISACDDNSYSGTLVHKEFNFTLAIDNSADRYFDLTVAAGPDSTWSNNLVSATYRKAA